METTSQVRLLLPWVFGRPSDCGSPISAVDAIKSESPASDLSIMGVAKVCIGSVTRISSELVEDLAELPGTGFALNPLGCTDSTECESFTREGVVAQFDNVVFAGGGDDVFAFGIADAVRFHLDIDAGLDGVDDFLESNRGAGWRIEFGSVVGFADGELVPFDAGKLGSEAEELLHAGYFQLRLQA
jgi:hypothetical protein